MQLGAPGLGVVDVAPGEQADVSQAGLTCERGDLGEGGGGGGKAERVGPGTGQRGARSLRTGGRSRTGTGHASPHRPRVMFRPAWVRLGPSPADGGTLGPSSDLFLVVVRLHVHRPGVETVPVEALDRQHRGQHRMILVVVAVHAIAAHRMDVGHLGFQPLADRLHLQVIAGVVDRVGLCHPDHEALLDVAGPYQTERRQLPDAEGHELVVGHGPKGVALEDEVLEA